MKLFDQIDFTGGLNAEYDRLKTPRNAYPLLLNGRIRNGNIQPVKKHVKDTTVPDGIYQTLITVGDYLVILVSGELLYRNIVTNGPWQRIPGWINLSTTATEIYATLIPVSTNFYNASGTPDASTQEFNLAIQQTPSALLLSDGSTNRLVFENLSWRDVGAYATWTQDNPEYMPAVLQSVVSGQKLFSISADRKKIYQSVSGRFTDFVINRTASADKGGDADTTAYSVDFNDLTGIHASEQGGLLATTLSAAYLLLKTDLQIFAEPVLSVGDPAFPVGAVNHKSFAKILGDIAFISQGGMNSINVAMQLQTESNNNPFSKPIARYLVNPQTDSCAVNFDDYALFSVNTTYGRAVIVYDTIRESFVSLDTGFGTVSRFAVYKRAGINRLFFINTDNELYEAYASDSYAVTRVLLGDYAYAEEGVSKSFKATELHFWFNNILSADAIRLSYYVDDVLIDASEMSPADAANDNIPPVVSPFVPQKNVLALRYSPPARTGIKCSIWLEWSGQMELVGASGSGSIESTVQSNSQSLVRIPDNPLIVLAEPDIHTLVGNTVTMTEISGLSIGAYYYVYGTAYTGNDRYTNALFKANMTTVNLNGKLYAVDNFYDLWQTARTTVNRQSTIITLGNFTDGTEISYQKLLALGLGSFRGAAGNKDLDDAVLSWYERNERYFIHQTDLVDFFILSGGWNSANDSVDSSGNPTGSSAEIDGYSATSDQAQWLRYWLNTSTKRFKVIILGYPAYTDESTYYPGFAPLRWPFAKWGADLVISRSPGAYERFYINGFPYINLGLGGGAAGTFAAGVNRSAARYTGGASYLEILPRRYSLDCNLITADGDTIDSTTIYPR